MAFGMESIMLRRVELMDKKAKKMRHGTHT